MNTLRKGDEYCIKPVFGAVSYHVPPVMGFLSKTRIVLKACSFTSESTAMAPAGPAPITATLFTCSGMAAHRYCLDSGSAGNSPFVLRILWLHAAGINTTHTRKTPKRTDNIIEYHNDDSNQYRFIAAEGPIVFPAQHSDRAMVGRAQRLALYSPQ